MTMKTKRLFPFVALTFLALPALADEPQSAPTQAPQKTFTQEEVTQFCVESLGKLPGKLSLPGAVEKICADVRVRPECVSAEGRPIFHWDRGGMPPDEHAKAAKDDDKQLNILVIGLIHGDEDESGSLVRLWSERLTRFMPHNGWRMIPIMNPDGWKKSTRTNSRGVDINRNFPTKDWESHAFRHWERDMKKNPRRFPGKEAASEPETKCVMAQVEEFKPDFVISVHTPYGILDLDGPRSGQLPVAKLPLPWKRLGTLPGSLGRYLWDERNLPVLTIELKGNETVAQKKRFEFLQDEMSRIFWASNEAMKKEEAAQQKAVAGAQGKKDQSAREKVADDDAVTASKSSPQPR